jgi:hypothetical protein
MENAAENFSGRLMQITTYTDPGTGWNAIFCRGDEDNDGTGQNAIWRVRGDGGTYADGAYSSGGADYSEYFESDSGDSIPVGTTVKLDGNKIVKCEDGDVPIGVIRPKNGSSVVIGNAYDGRWAKMYKQDNYGAYIYEEYTVDGVLYERRIGNPDYVKDREYTNREKRDEWCLVGLLGQIPITKGQPMADSWSKMEDVSDTVETWFVK